MSKPSRAHNFAYVIFGYALAYTLIQRAAVESTTDFLLLIAIAGGFIGTFLFFTKPEEKLLLLLFYLRTNTRISVMIVFSSAYLTEIKGKITSYTYFFLTCMILAYNRTALGGLVNASFPLLYVVLGAATVVLLMSVREIIRLPRKMRVLQSYYGALTANRTDTYQERRFREILTDLRYALDRGDWTEAGILSQHVERFAERGEEGTDPLRKMGR
jgi:hypothetical protein